MTYKLFMGANKCQNSRCNRGVFKRFKNLLVVSVVSLMLSGKEFQELDPDHRQKLITSRGHPLSMPAEFGRGRTTPTFHSNKVVSFSLYSNKSWKTSVSSRRPVCLEQLTVINVETSYFTQLKMCYLMTTFRCPSDISITS